MSSADEPETTPEQSSTPEQAGSPRQDGPEQVRPERPPAGPVVFQPSRLTLLGIVAFCVFAIPFAFGAPWFWLVYLLPVAAAAWIVRTRTTVGPDSVTVRRLLAGRRVRWDEISSLRLGKKSRVSAVLTDGEELPLPAVRVRDLPVLAAVSGGRFTFPTDE
ncbi:MAG: PH domain-containing protein [Pseudonocardia sp.]|nr:PH domain-containing protein [Pseudonocardia sp.]